MFSACSKYLQKTKNETQSLTLEMSGVIDKGAGIETNAEQDSGTQSTLSILNRTVEVLNLFGRLGLVMFYFYLCDRLVILK